MPREKDCEFILADALRVDCNFFLGKNQWVIYRFVNKIRGFPHTVSWIGFQLIFWLNNFLLYSW